MYYTCWSALLNYMRVQNITPSKTVSDYVERILVIEYESFVTPFVLPLYANGVPSLLFTSVKGEFRNGNANYLTLFGQTTAPDQLTLKDDFTLIAYFLKPHALVSLFGISALELTDEAVDLSLVSKSSTSMLLDQLLHSSGLQEMLVALDCYLHQLIRTAKEVAPSLTYAYEQLVTNYSKETILNLQRELNISEKSLQRMFAKNIGISPNTFRRVRQFDAAFNDLNFRRFSNLSDIAYNHGYADQSHYIRAFKEFTAITPSEYLRLGKES